MYLLLCAAAKLGARTLHSKLLVIDLPQHKPCAKRRRPRTDSLRALAAKHELIGDVRGSGLFIGVEMVRDRDCKTPASEETARVVNGMRQRRALISATGREGRILKSRPPLVFSSDDAKLFLATPGRGADGAVADPTCRPASASVRAVGSGTA